MNINSDLVNFCDLYNLPFNHLGAILKDPKVIPMIRGKAFEFSVADKLSAVLSNEIWKIEKPFLNPQLGYHDQDVLITHIPSNKKISIECKLSAKGRIKSNNSGYILSVKCMRSRTLGEELASRLAPERGVPKDSLLVHNDQYLSSDFDFVITSLANVFYATNSDGIFVWSPSEAGLKFLYSKYGINKTDKGYQDLAFNDMYVASSHDLAISNNGNICTRKKCDNKLNCKFIPNYPLIEFDKNANVIQDKWFHISEIEHRLLKHIGEY